MDKTGKSALYYTWTITGAGLAFLLLLAPELRAVPMGDVVFFVLLMLASEALPVALPRGDGTVSVSFALSYAGMILYGPSAAAWIAALGTIRIHDLRGRVPFQTVLFNRAMLGLVAGLSAYTYILFGSTPGMPRLPEDLPALAACAAANAVLNVLLTMPLFVLKKGGKPWAVFVGNIRWVIPNLTALASIGILLAILYVNHGILSVAFLFGPLLIARYSFQRYISIRDTYLQTIKALMRALETKDEHTRGHSERVAQHAMGIGRKMGLEEDTLELLQYVGILHDIGKIGIRDAILKKPGMFTASEYGEMQRHPTIGADIIKEIRFLGQSASWVRYHHERFGGGGFPERLKGEEIPLGARIIAVADAFDAIVSDRPYKAALSLEEAREEILRSSGSQFDPDVVHAFIDYMDTELLAKSHEGADGLPC